MLAAAALLMAAACEETPAPFETEIPARPITALVKQAIAYWDDEAFEGVIDNTDHTITFQFEKEGVDLSAIKVHMEIISRAVASTGCFTDTTLNLTEPYSFAVNNLEKDIIYTIEGKLPNFYAVDRNDLSVLYGRTGDAQIDTDNGYGVTFSKNELFDGQWMSGYQCFGDVAYHYFGWVKNQDNPWFTFKSKEPFKMFKARVYPYWGFRQYDPCQFQIWAYTGSGELPEATPSDWKTNGSWKMIADVDISDLWLKIQELLTDTSNVGNPEYDPCVNGAEFQISDYCSDIPSSQYYRFVVVNSFYGVYKTEMDSNNWSARVSTITMSELQVWKYGEE